MAVSDHDITGHGASVLTDSAITDDDMCEPADAFSGNPTYYSADCEWPLFRKSGRYIVIQALEAIPMEMREIQPHALPSRGM